MSERLRLDELPWEPWKNGAGRTREIARGPAGAGLDDFDWRLSVAEIAADAPFSAFPGIDRCLVLLHGAGMLLRDTAGAPVHRIDRAGAPVRFDGELGLHAELLGGPCEDFNVMTRRGRWRSEVHVAEAPLEVAPADAAFVLGLGGAPAIGGDALAPGELWQARVPADGAAVQGGGRVLVVRLLREAGR